MSLDLRSLFADAPPDAALYGVVGENIAYSLSPAMHQAALGFLNIPVFYGLMDVRAADWGAFCDQASRLPLAGFNVTKPFKEMAHGRFHPQSAAGPLGSVNTVRRGPGGGWAARSTDGEGFLTDLLDHRVDWTGKNILVLGAGGAARAILHGVVESRKAGVVAAVNRSEERGRLLKEKLEGIEILSPSVLAARLDGFDLVINTTSVGLKEGDPLPFPALSGLREGQVVYDAIYHHDTALLRRARSAGARAINGLGMLVNQGALALEWWFEEELKKNVKYTPVRLRDIMRAAAENELKARAPS
jgi:shikimate dehydrogenase